MGVRDDGGKVGCLADVWFAVDSRPVPGPVRRAGHVRGQDIGHRCMGTARDAWVFGRFFPFDAWHYNGRRWSKVRWGHGLFDGSALSPHGIWAVGGTQVTHWNGTVGIFTRAVILVRQG
jgi:hypothetical protein